MTIYLIEKFEHNEIMSIFKNTQINGHYYLSPSKLYQRKKCPASAALEIKFQKEEKNKIAEDGTQLHDLIQKAIETNDVPDNRHVAAAYKFARDVVDLRDGKEISCELKVDTPYVKGTTDFTFQWIMGAQKNRTVVDWKTGYMSDDIEAYTEQLRAYTAALMITNGENFGEWYAFSTERNEIICSGVIDSIQEAERIIEEIRDLKNVCESGTAFFAVNNHCKYCQGADNCPLIINIFEDLGLPRLPELYSLTTLEALDISYEKLSIAEKQLGKIKEKLTGKIKELGGTEKYKVIKTKGRVDTDWEAFSSWVLTQHPDYAEKLSLYQSFKDGYERILKKK